MHTPWCWMYLIWVWILACATANVHIRACDSSRPHVMEHDRTLCVSTSFLVKRWADSTPTELSCSSLEVWVIDWSTAYICRVLSSMTCALSSDNSILPIRRTTHKTKCSFWSCLLLLFVSLARIFLIPLILNSFLETHSSFAHCSLLVISELLCLSHLGTRRSISHMPIGTFLASRSIKLSWLRSTRIHGCNPRIAWMAQMSLMSRIRS